VHATLIVVRSTVVCGDRSVVDAGIFIGAGTLPLVIVIAAIVGAIIVVVVVVVVMLPSAIAVTIAIAEIVVAGPGIVDDFKAVVEDGLLVVDASGMQ
jgi:hypothetical protein